jgi:hypothetical protein
MTPINETAQPVNPANITEADVFAFVAKAKELVTAATTGLANYATQPDVFIYRDSLRINAFINPGFDSVSGDGKTIEAALTNFLAALTAKKLTAATLREQAAELMRQAAEIEGGAK